MRRTEKVIETLSDHATNHNSFRSQFPCQIQSFGYVGHIRRRAMVDFCSDPYRPRQSALWRGIQIADHVIGTDSGGAQRFDAAIQRDDAIRAIREGSQQPSLGTDAISD